MAQQRKLGSDVVRSATGPDDALVATEERSLAHPLEPTETQPSLSYPAPPRTATCEGAILGIEADRIVGWALDTARPHECVDVELFIDGVRVGYGPANRFDAELAQAKGGNGMHRFELALDRLPDALPPYLIRAVITGTEKELCPSLTLANRMEAEQLLAGSEYVGKVTGIEDGALCGWVFNRSNPSERPLLTLFDGDITILTRSAAGQIGVVLESGAKIDAHRFELPLPGTALDGHQHSFAVRVDSFERELAGSPVLFGPNDLASIGRSLASLSERLQRLDARLDSFQPELDPGVLERRITLQILERIDMLLNIHRDSLERELAVLRRQIAELYALRPDGNADVIRPVPQQVPAVQQIVAPTAREFTLVARSLPSNVFDLSTHLATVTTSGALTWSGEVSGGVVVGGDGALTLQGVPEGSATIILRGKGGYDPLEFCGIVATFHGSPLTGRLEMDEKGDWTLIGTTIEGQVFSHIDELGFAYLSDLARPSGALCLREISVFAPDRAPDRIERAAPQSTIVFLGSGNQRGGWYPVEAGPRGGSCWMGGYGELSFRIRQTGKYRLTIPEIRPLVAGIVPKLQILVNGSPISLDISHKDGDAAAFRLTANFRAPFQENDTVRIRLNFPRECVKSPLELGLNNDQRALTVCMRSIALSAVEA